MSLDLDLVNPLKSESVEECTCQCGHLHQKVEDTTEVFFSTNITHNLNKMFDDAGAYQILWHGDGKTAGESLPQLEASLLLMEKEPDRFIKFEAGNRGWGTYKQALIWLRTVIAGFKKNPEGIIQCSR